MVQKYLNKSKINNHIINFYYRLPSVRVIPDAADPLSLEESSNSGMNYGLLHPNFRASPSVENASSSTGPSPATNLPPRPQRPTPPSAALLHDFGAYPSPGPTNSQVNLRVSEKIRDKYMMIFFKSFRDPKP